MPCPSLLSLLALGRPSPAQPVPQSPNPGDQWWGWSLSPLEDCCCRIPRQKCSKNLQIRGFLA